jgi:hypothetical protein
VTPYNLVDSYQHFRETNASICRVEEYAKHAKTGYKERGVEPESAKENSSQSPGSNPPPPYANTIFPWFT